MSPEDVEYWREQLRDAETRFETYRQANGAAIERVKEFKANFGVKENSDGSLKIDFEKLAKGLGMTGALELRQVIDETYNVTGNAGDKPHIKLANG